MVGCSWILVGVAVALAAIGLFDRLRASDGTGALPRARTGAVDVEAAVKARQRAEAASEAKSRFLATLSHEIRTPLNGILGLADLLAGTALDREQHAYVEAVKSSGEALATLIDEILDFSRIEAGRLELQSESFDLVGLVEGVVELLAPRAQHKGLEIASQLDPTLPRRVVGDPVRLRQVLTNLAGNAVKFTEQGGVGVSVRAGAAGRLAFTVADTGPGVPIAHRSSIFEDFEQGDGSMSRRHGGTGLGLAISKRIVERMGGSLTHADRPGGGSVFGFGIDLPPASGEARSGAAPASRLDLAGWQALIAAGSAFQAGFLADQLGAAGATAEVSPDLEAAVQHLETGPHVDLLLVDCALGEAAIEELAAAARRFKVSRAFLLFSPFERRAFGEARLSGYDGWLVKPVRSGSLAARLGSVDQGQDGSGRGGAPTGHAHRTNMRVLVAEDNDINTLVVSTYLDRLGAEMVHAADGTRALECGLAAIRGECPPFDMILLDVSMPGLDGLEVARRLRSAERAAGQTPTWITALTAHAFAEDRLACIDAGMDDVLTKPADFRRLSAALTAAEQRKEQGKAPLRADAVLVG